MNDNATLIFARFNDLCKKASKSKTPCSLSFLSPAELKNIESISFPLDLECKFWGGYESAERKTVIVYPSFMTFEDDFQMSFAAEIKVLHVRNTAGKSLSHRDFLGALMSIGIQRETIGDILVCDDEALIFIKTSIYKYVASALDKVGNCRVVISELDSFDDISFEKFLPTKIKKDIIVPSMRLDAIISDVYAISRNESQKLIKSGACKLNHAVCLNCDKSLTYNDLVSVLGKGRFEIHELTGETKKGNLRLNVLIYT